MTPTPDDYDSPWKDILDAYLVDFMRRFDSLPDWVAQRLATATPTQ